MRRDGFDPKVISDKLYFLDCTKGQYVELNAELYRSIASGKQKLWDYYQPPPVPSSPRLQQPSNPAPSSLRPSLPQQTQWRAAAKHSGRVFKSSFIHSHSPPLLWPRRNWGGIQPGGHLENKTKKIKPFIIQEYKKTNSKERHKDQTQVCQIVKLSLCLSCTILAWLQDSGLKHVHFDGFDKRMPSWMCPLAQTKPTRINVQYKHSSCHDLNNAVYLTCTKYI